MDLASHKDSEKTLTDMARLLEINREMAATGDRDELLEKIIAFSLDLLGVQRGTLFLYDRRAEELVANIATGLDSIRVPADKGFCGECIKTGTTIVIPDAYADERFNPAVDKKTGFKTRNIMSIPLRGYDDGLVGVLQVLNRKDGDFDDYDVMLAETLGAQAGVIIQKANLIRHLIEKQRMERAMQIARDIQQGLLPDDSPKIDGFDAAGLSDPADETGGDIYDFIPLPGNRWAFVVADATGHGIGPAMVISETRSMLRTAARFYNAENLDIGEIMGTVNSLLHDDLNGNSFVTCFLGVLDAEKRMLSYVSAGHGPLLFYAAGSDAFRRVKATGLPLGIMDEAPVPNIETFSFHHADDMAIVTTDGIFEADNGGGELFGVARMEDAIRRQRGQSAAAIIQGLRDEVGHFSPPPQADDITAVLIKRT